MHKRPLEGHSAPTGLDKPTALVAFKNEASGAPLDDNAGPGMRWEAYCGANEASGAPRDDNAGSGMCWESDCGVSEASGAPFTISRFQRFTCSPFLLFTFSSFQLFTCSLSYLSTAFKENKTHGIFLFKLRSTLMLPGLGITLKREKITKK